jgi:hypothetical protein
MHLGYGLNEYGTRLSKHRCDVCGVDFEIVPAYDGDISCRVLPCPSYDPATDVDKQLFNEDGSPRADATIGLVELPKDPKDRN